MYDIPARFVAGGQMLWTENIPGNLHQAAETLNKMNVAKYVLTMEFSGSATVVVFRIPSNLYDWLVAEREARNQRIEDNMKHKHRHDL